MAEEFVIKSDAIEDKINQLLPSLGGFQAGVDFSASTMVVPIIDLTETAEGSGLRQDLQKSMSLTAVTSFDVNNTTSTLINTTGYFRVFGNLAGSYAGASTSRCSIQLTDGTTTKVVFGQIAGVGFNNFASVNFDFIVLIKAGESLTATSFNSVQSLVGCTRQIADLSGNLVNP